ncbi:unnamed protein product [Linum tenue]|uniref:F-box domain-containing protein n=1 Tax=Linum tenue TaxID=586396 RepID=A0AAV0QMA6_9ROSI|nr:unnamed protein product [Linum tenue]
MTGRDRISGLPSNVVEHILRFLPLREAVRTSVVSRKWANKWVHMRALVLDDKFGKVVKPVASAANNKLMLDVCNVLMRHRARLNAFSLSIPDLRSAFSDHRIGQIIGSLDDQHIESLSIEIKDYVLPSCIFSFTRLKNLKLCGCQFRSSVVAFHSSAFAELDVLELRGLAVPKLGGEARFSFNCPLLSSLTMEGCGLSTNKIGIVIEAPKLDYCRISGSFSLLEFKHTPLLKTVHVHQDLSYIEDKGYSNFKKFTDALRSVEQLSISGYFYNIGKQQVFVDGSQNLVIKSKNRRAQLKRVKVEQFDGTKMEMGLVRSLLSASPALDQMEIKFSASHRDRWLICKEMLGFARASPTAQIAIE